LVQILADETQSTTATFSDFPVSDVTQGSFDVTNGIPSDFIVDGGTLKSDEELASEKEQKSFKTTPPIMGNGPILDVMTPPASQVLGTSTETVVQSPQIVSEQNSTSPSPLIEQKPKSRHGIAVSITKDIGTSTTSTQATPAIKAARWYDWFIRYVKNILKW